MKVAISIPDPVFKAAERLARDLKKSRSQLYAEAVQRFIGSHGEIAVREQLNAVYSVQDSALDPVLEKLQAAALKDETW